MSTVSVSEGLKKGQSAIEYLMTYGWMLLVVAIVGGAIFSIVQSESVESVSGFTGSDVAVDDFGLSSEGGLDLVLRNTAAESVEVNSVNVSDGDRFRSFEFVSGKSISVGETGVVTLAGVSEGSGANSLDVTVNYDSGGLSDLEVSGTVSGSFEITESGSMTGFSEPSDSAPSDLAAVHDGMAGSGTSDDPYVVTDDHELQAMNHDLTADYVLGQNIDASGTSSWNNGDGFTPIGDDTSEFTGSLDGDGYVVDGLYINRPSTDYVGLIGYSGSSSSVSNIGVVNADVTGNEYVGGLFGYNYGDVTSSYSTGSVDGNEYVGGLFGINNGDVTSSYSTGSVSGDRYVGGLVGQNYHGTVEDSYSTGNVNGTGDNVGGLVGYNADTVTSSYSTGSVTGDQSVGGLVGINYGDVTSSYWDTESSGQSSGIGDGSGDVTGLATSEMQGDSYDSGFETDIVDKPEFTGVTGDYPELPWESE